MKEKLVNVGIFWAVPNKWEGGWSFYIDDEALKTYRKESEDNMKFVYDHSDDIMQALKND